ncbi:hypothetical protein [Rhizobium binae]|uniref:hypothetical protein n=1 Tax=Rhizobium binae TaxID=1138190 RepID=UPI001C8333C7|nr:hypothetical protein [Rhizobium binae]MBX4967588.1 hypothetical protein [Rhizobium binae]
MQADHDGFVTGQRFKFDETLCSFVNTFLSQQKQFLLESEKNRPTFDLSATKRKEGDPMSNEISDLVTGMEEVMKARQPSL